MTAQSLQPQANSKLQEFLEQLKTALSHINWQDINFGYQSQATNLAQMYSSSQDYIKVIFNPEWLALDPTSSLSLYWPQTVKDTQSNNSQIFNFTTWQHEQAKLYQKLVKEFDPKSFIPWIYNFLPLLAEQAQDAAVADLTTSNNSYSLLQLWRRAIIYPRATYYPYLKLALQNNQVYKLARSSAITNSLAPHLEQILTLELTAPTPFLPQATNILQLIKDLDWEMHFDEQEEVREFEWLLAHSLPASSQVLLQSCKQELLCKSSEFKNLSRRALAACWHKLLTLYFELSLDLQQDLQPNLEQDIQPAILTQFNQKFATALTVTELTQAVEQLAKDFTQYFIHGTPISVIEEKTLFYHSYFSHPGTSVLKPRSATEFVVDTAYDLAQQRVNAVSHAIKQQELTDFATFTLVDIGAGSGCLGATCLQLLASKNRHAPFKFHLLSLDIDPQALKVAQYNLQRVLDAKNMSAQEISDDEFLSARAKDPTLQNKYSYEVLASDWLSALKDKNLPHKVQVIVSNPPYIDKDDPLLVHTVHDPFISLVPEHSGIYPYQEILLQAINYLDPQGVVVFEHGYNQKQALEELVQQINERPEVKAQGQYSPAIVLADYSGNPRCMYTSWQPIKE
ncbi:hypothetical protein [Psittacicella hinzii]|uniref:Uncharacterized protein n=1 Tax=Psittacicella hinzii TaxID=2028575 RepID=A0A3A1YRW2_9GAMM|nr:hypothetical protein [Psittacicella hinzii]RIY39989.1 hypothetical protein CKF58_01290 [Psittacicella hinzii]